MSNYKKRGQKGWTGKKEAKTKEYRERLYAKKEIEKELKIEECGDSFREKPKPSQKKDKKIKNKIKSLENSLEFWEQRAEEAKGKPDCKYFGYSWYRSRAEDMKKQIQKLKEK